MKHSLWTLLQRVVTFLLLYLLTVSGSSSKRRVLTPTFLPTKMNVTVPMGELAVLECRIRNLGPKQVSWRKVANDYPLTVGTLAFDPKEEVSVDHKKLNSIESQWNLIIKRAQPRHSGKYECQISAKDIYTHHVYLTVLDTPRVVQPDITITGTEYVSLFDEIRLVCNATGAYTAPEDIDWFHEGHLISTSSPRWVNRIRITEYKPEVPGRSLISQLVVEHSFDSDAGRYVCRSSDLKTDRIITSSMDVNVLNSREEARKLARDAELNRKGRSKAGKDIYKRQEKNNQFQTGQQDSQKTGSCSTSHVPHWATMLFIVLIAMNSKQR